MNTPLQATTEPDYQPRQPQTGDRPRILLTGATGYIGGRLLEALQARNVSVRCMTRRPENLRESITENTEVVAGDILDLASLVGALDRVDVAYYLIHSMGSASAFEEQDRRGATNFAEAARKAGVRRIIYLGGLGDASEDLSSHLRSRQEVGEILRSSGVEVIEFRASIVLGSGSLSFEMIRALVERLPIMITPRWVSILAQPIAINDVLDYLCAAIDLPHEGSRVFEIGGADQVSYGELMKEYARQRGLRRWLIRVPFLTPRLSSLWLGLVTPLYARVGRKLIESIRHPTVVQDNTALSVFPIKPLGYREAIASALRNEDREFAQTRWSDAVSSSGLAGLKAETAFGPRLEDSRTATVNVPPEQAFAAIRRIGGNTGWYYANWLWRIRGAIDLLLGGVGMRRGRRDPETLRVGDTVDCWRVEAIEKDRRLRLAAEMKLPGRAWLEFEVQPTESGSTIRQTAMYDPVGLLGRAYWYMVYPFHLLVFAGMLRGIADAGEKMNTRTEPHVPPSVSRQVVAFLSILIVCLGVAGLGGYWTAQSVGDWYAGLEKAPWNPPAWVFGPVWTTLYICMALAAFLVWRREGFRRARTALTLFGVQLLFNLAWSGLFFGLRSPGAALVDILLLWLAIFATWRAFRRISPVAGWLLVPYLLWVSYAVTLNFEVWRRNP